MSEAQFAHRFNRRCCGRAMPSVRTALPHALMYHPTVATRPATVTTLEAPMVIARVLALIAAVTLLAAPALAQDGGIKIEKFTHSAWTRGIFSEAVTVTGVGNAKFVYLAGVGAEDENGPRGNIRHHGNFLEQCKYAYDKIKRVLAHHGANLRDVVKITTYITDLRYRLTLGECVKDQWSDVTFPTNTLIGVAALAFPEMIIEVDATAIVVAK
jgi:enamine deaminase RidA (YjgF/YER057c/UK114 family)